jgi:membrane protease YdiL (CAAX protease family)
METGTQQAIEFVADTRSDQNFSPESLKSRRIADLGLVLLIAICPLLINAVYALFIPSVGSTASTNGRFISGLVHEAGALVLLVVLLRRQQRSLNDIGFNFAWADVPKALGLFIIAYFAWLAAYYLIDFAYYFGTLQHVGYRDPSAIFVQPSMILLALYILGAPLFEETIVRGYLMTELASFSCPVWLAAVTSVIVQTSYHLYYGFAGALSVGCGFVVFAVYFARSKRLMPVMLAHLFWDLTASAHYWHR